MADDDALRARVEAGVRQALAPLVNAVMTPVTVAQVRAAVAEQLAAFQYQGLVGIQPNGEVTIQLVAPGRFNATIRQWDGPYVARDAVAPVTAAALRVRVASARAREDWATPLPLP